MKKVYTTICLLTIAIAASAQLTLHKPETKVATDITSSSFTANWGAVPNADGYCIFVYDRKEVRADGEQLVLLKGGRGGLGNWHFKSATNQTPRYAQPGEEGDEGTFILELKVLADVGLVGFPNAGKSTLLSVVSAAKPKIANYAFTTLEPNLGIVEVRDHKSFVMADIPGIIEGAHEGRGLGTRFLRHIERNSVLLFMIPADSDDLKRDYAVLLGELTQYNPELLDKQRLLAITKCDMLDDELIEEMKSHLPEGVPSVFISSVSGLNISRLKDMLWEALQR